MVGNNIATDVESPMKRQRKNMAGHPLRRLLAIPLMVAPLLAVHTARAGAPVIDITSIMTEMRAWLDDTLQYARQADHWKQVQAQIDDGRAIFDPLRFSVGLPAGAMLQTVAPDYLVVEACGKRAAGLQMERALTALRFSGREEWEAQQRQICVNIQMMQNRKFNETVTFLEHTIDQAESTMREIFRARQDSNNTSGGVQATQSDTARLTNHLSVMAQQWSTRMQGYDAYIAVMQSRQNIVARAALQGDPTAEALSDLVQTTALEAALRIERP